MVGSRTTFEVEFNCDAAKRPVRRLLDDVMILIAVAGWSKPLFQVVPQIELHERPIGLKGHILLRDQQTF